MIKKRFLLFAYDDYYPKGGLDDWIDSFDNVHDAIVYFKEECDYEEGGVLDIETFKTYTYNRKTKKWNID